MTLAEFMQPPTQAQWLWALKHGWPGPDGSSASTDHIMGVRIGITSAKWEDAHYPANKHDWRFFLGRLAGLPESYRREADKGYRDDCLRCVHAQLSGWRLYTAISRCHVRYVALRVGARFAWTQAQRLSNLSWQPAFPGA